MTLIESNIRKPQFFYIQLSCLTVIISFAYLHFFEQILNLGYFTSPVIWFVALSEVLISIVIKIFLQSDESTSYKPFASRDKKKNRDRKSNKFMDAAQILFLTCVGIVFFSFIAIVLGAPFLSSHEQTFSLAILLATTTVTPLAIIAGPSGAIKTLFHEESAFTTKYQQEILILIKNSIVGVILGAWGASIVAPLDWDREWQAYPIPNMIGALMGLILGNIYSAGYIILTPIIEKFQRDTMF